MSHNLARKLSQDIIRVIHIVQLKPLLKGDMNYLIGGGGGTCMQAPKNGTKKNLVTHAFIVSSGHYESEQCVYPDIPG